MMKRTRSGTVIPIPNTNRSRKICLVLSGGITDNNHFIYLLDTPPGDDDHDDQESQSQYQPLPEPVMVLDLTYPSNMAIVTTQSSLYFMGGMVFKNKQHLLDHEKDSVDSTYIHPSEVAVLQKSVYKLPLSKPPFNMVKQCDLISAKILPFCETIPGTGKICVGDLVPSDRVYGPSNLELYDEETGQCSKLPDPLPAESEMLGCYVSEFPNKLYILSQGGKLAVLDLSRNNNYEWVYIHIPCLRFWEPQVSYGLIVKVGDGVGDIEHSPHILFPTEWRHNIFTFPSSLENLSQLPPVTEVDENHVVHENYVAGDIAGKRFYFGCLLAPPKEKKNANNRVLYRVHSGFKDGQLSNIVIDSVSFDMSKLTLNFDDIRSKSVYHVQPPSPFLEDDSQFFYGIYLV